MERRVSARSGRGSPRGDGWNEDGDMPRNTPYLACQVLINAKSPSSFELMYLFVRKDKGIS